MANREGKRKRRQRVPSPRFMTFREVAELFTVDESTVRKGLGIFGRLRRIALTERRTVLVRSEVERMARELERGAPRLAPLLFVGRRFTYE